MAKVRRATTVVSCGCLITAVLLLAVQPASAVISVRTSTVSVERPDTGFVDVPVPVFLEISDTSPAAEKISSFSIPFDIELFPGVSLKPGGAASGPSPPDPDPFDENPPSGNRVFFNNPPGIADLLVSDNVASAPLFAEFAPGSSTRIFDLNLRIEPNAMIRTYAINLLTAPPLFLISNEFGLATGSLVSGISGGINVTTVIPEPSSIMLLSLVALGTAIWRRVTRR